MKTLTLLPLNSSFCFACQRLLAQIVCKVIPDSCPFERTVFIGDITVHIPPLCKLNPFYDMFIAPTFLADYNKLN